MHRLNDADNNPSLTVGRIARMFQCSDRHVANLCDNGALPCHRIGNDRRVMMCDVVAFAARNRIPLNLEESMERAVAEMRMHFDAQSLVSVDMELHWRRAACALYRDAMREVFSTLASRSTVDGSLVLDNRTRIRLLDLTRIARVADDKAGENTASADETLSRAADVAARIRARRTEVTP